ncbi:hypothetical protein KC356_g70 [Hortaea werneckii]|nr:hypothetical protein KC356_g70 [Hortaea werneckii]
MVSFAFRIFMSADERGRAQASDLRRTRDTCPDARRPGLHHLPAALLPALMSRTLLPPSESSQYSIEQSW